MNEETKRFTLRLPKSIFDKIDEEAKNNFRSTNAEIIIAIKKYLDSLNTHKEKTK